MILKENGQVVPAAQDNAGPSIDQAAPPTSKQHGLVSQEERDLMAELIRIGESSIDVSSAAPPPSSSQLNFMPNSTTRHQMPDFDFPMDEYANEKEFSFDELFQ